MDVFFVDTVFDSSLALLAIIVPLGVAYVILLWQARKSPCGRRKAPAITREELLQKRAELSHAAKEKYGQVRLAKRAA